MRVLHVHQIANIPPLIVRELRKKGIEADFVEDVRDVDLKKYDIVHGHYALNRSTIRAFRMARHNNVPFVLHYHGSDVRRATITGRKKLPFHFNAISKYMRKRSTKIFLSTPDLIEFTPEGEYVPNPVDLEAFRPMPEVEKSTKTLICGKFLRGSRIFDLISPDKEYDCVNTGDDIEFPSNVSVLPFVPYDNFPVFLNRYKEMIGTLFDLISMTRFCAMACGLKTFTKFDEAFTKYYDGQNPDEVDDPRAFVQQYHNPDICIKRLIEVYGEIVQRQS